MNYEQKYKEIVTYVNSMYEQCKNVTKEPDWPDKIEDRKQVIWFRNDVFDHAFELGIISGIKNVYRFIEQQKKAES